MGCSTSNDSTPKIQLESGEVLTVKIETADAEMKALETDLANAVSAAMKQRHQSPLLGIAQALILREYNGRNLANSRSSRATVESLSALPDEAKQELSAAIGLGPCSMDRRAPKREAKGTAPLVQQTVSLRAAGFGQMRELNSPVELVPISSPP